MSCKAACAYAFDQAILAAKDDLFEVLDNPSATPEQRIAALQAFRDALDAAESAYLACIANCGSNP
jgi:hypothetical protein